MQNTLLVATLLVSMQFTFSVVEMYHAYEKNDTNAKNMLCMVIIYIKPIGSIKMDSLA